LQLPDLELVRKIPCDPQILFFTGLDEIYFGRGRRDVLGGMTFKVIKGQGQGHRTFKFKKLAYIELNILTFN